MTDIYNGQPSHPDAFHPVWPDVNGDMELPHPGDILGVQKHELLQFHPDPGDPGVAEQGFVAHEVDVRPPHEIFGDIVEGMSAREKRSFVEKHLILAKLYDGSGGP